MRESFQGLVALNPHQARTVADLFERMFPSDEHGAGETGAVVYLDRALAGAYSDKIEVYRNGLATLDRAAMQLCGEAFIDCAVGQQDALIGQLERGDLPDFSTPPQRTLFGMLREHLQEGLFADPAYGGNRDMLGWKFLGHPGVWLENSAEENLAIGPATKGGRFQSLRDLGFSPGEGPMGDEELPGYYDPQKSVEPPSGPVDVVLVGLGGVGALISPVLTSAGLRVVALEAGPWRYQSDFIPDELGVAYWCRANMGEKFMSESPRWRRNEGEPTQEATYSLGRMVNGVGGSLLHWGAWLRRFHPHHHRFRSHVLERWGEEALPEDSTLVDWPVSYDDLEPYYALLDHLIGIAGGDGDNPFIPRKNKYPLPPLRPTRLTRLFHETAAAMGLHPHPVPVGVNSKPYNGYPETRYSALSLGFGPINNDRWHPLMTSIPEALATGNLDLKTHCRVVKVLTDGDGRARGVEYVDANGTSHVQEAPTVILCSYTFENVRLLLLSGDRHRKDGLGNNEGQVGKHFMTKMFAHVDGYFPDKIFNRHTAPASQTEVVDDFLAEDYDSYGEGGFVGGATLGVENGLMPIQISRQSLPPDVPSWGQGYKDHLRGWQHWCTARLQPDTLSYRSNFLDLDPRYRDGSGLGLPLVRITYDLRENEQRLAEHLEGKAEEILRTMGATKTWRGRRFTGVGSSHDLGGCRMGEDPVSSVVDPDLRVHDTPGLYVFGGAVFPTCPGINPSLALLALCYRAAERLLARLDNGEES